MMMIVDALRKKDISHSSGHDVLCNNYFFFFSFFSFFKFVQKESIWLSRVVETSISLFHTSYRTSHYIANILVRRRGKAMMGIITMWNYIWLKIVFVIICAKRIYINTLSQFSQFFYYVFSSLFVSLSRIYVEKRCHPREELSIAIKSLGRDEVVISLHRIHLLVNRFFIIF